MQVIKKVKSNLFLYIKQIIENKRKNVLMNFFLFILSFFYKFFVLLKNKSYDLKILKPKKVKSKVISIGNIDCGGTGKTPFIIFLANLLMTNKKVAIITRGYKSKYENKSLFVDKDKKFDVSDMGDEPFLIKKRLKNVSVFIGKDKYKSAKKASDLNYDIILIDDGFQCRKLKKDIEIVLSNPKTFLLKNNCLPKGLLREPLKNLKRADYVVINNADKKDSKLEGEIKKYAFCPVIYSKPVPAKFLDLSKNIVNIKKKTKVSVFCGIANPFYFFKTIEDMDLEIVNKLELLDHESISTLKLQDFLKEAFEKKAEFVITTEKDFVKLNFHKKTNPLIVYLEINLNIVANKKNMKTLVAKIYKLSDN